MTEAELRVFVGIIKHYFEQQTALAADIYTPYLADPDALPIYDYTGVIGISGNRQGCVYFTAPTELLRQIGNEFLISVPVVVQGRNQAISLPKGVKAYIIPFCWQQHDAALVVSVV